MKNLKILYVVAFLLISTLGVYYYKDILLGNYKNPSKDVTKDSVITEDEKKNYIDRKYNVTGMYCTSCKSKIEKSVKDIKGVYACEINQDTSEMIVTYKRGGEKVKETLNVVKELGYGIGLKSKDGKLQVLDFNVRMR